MIKTIFSILLLSINISLFAQNEGEIKTNDGIHKTLFSNGVIKRIVFIKDGLVIKDSLFYENGKMKLIKKSLDGELIHQEKYNEKGILIKENNFENNKKNGLQKDNYKSGQTKIIENYENGMLVHREAFFENGITKLDENFRFNKKHGKQEYFDIKGILTEQKEYYNNILVKHEKYLPNGKELITVTNNIAEIKTYNKNNKLVKLSFENLTTKKSDSICLVYDETNGNRISEIAYNDGKIIRKGQYHNNKRNGKWVTFWKNEQKETQQFYIDGDLKKMEIISYKKQIKNNIKESDMLFVYNSYSPKQKRNYILVRFDSVQGKSKELIHKSIITSLKNNNLEPIRYNNNLKDQQLHSIIYFTRLKTRLKQKEGKDKYVYMISLDVVVKNTSDNKFNTENIIATPATKNESITKCYTKNKKDAFFKTLNNFEKIVTDILGKYYTLKGLARIKDKSELSAKSVYINLGKKHGVNKGDIFVVNNDNQIMVTIEIESVLLQTSIGRVISGNKWLYSNSNNNGYMIVYRNKKYLDH